MMYKLAVKHNNYMIHLILVIGILCAFTPGNAKTDSSSPKYVIFQGRSEESSPGFFLSENHLTEVEQGDFRRKLESLKLPRGSTQPKVKLKAKEYPRILRDLKTVNVLTAQGVLDLPISAVNLFFTVDGSSDYPPGLFVDLKTSTTMSGLVVLGGKFSPKASIRPEKMGAIIRDVDKSSIVAANVWKQVVSSLDNSTKKSLETAKVGPASLYFVSGHFPNGAVWLVYYEDSMQNFRFSALVDAKGSVVFTLLPPTYRTGEGSGSWTPNFITDIDGDGVEEIIATIGHWESQSNVLYQVRDGKMTETKFD